MIAVDLVRSEVIPAMVERIVERFHPDRIILFGSYARGDAGQHSDVDLLIVFREIEDEHRAAVEVRRALSGFRVPKDIVVATPGDIARRGNLVGPIFRPALREGLVLYEHA